jgi:hypothetical protein
MGLVYKNRLIINQRGGSIDIDNTTEQEKIKVSHRSGSNINMTNVVNSELATNNKQVNIVHDLFETVGNDKSIFIANNSTTRTGGNTFQLKGFINQSQLDAYTLWKDSYEPIALLNSEFKIKRGGISYPKGAETEQSGNRADNPVVGSVVYTVENTFHGYNGIPIRTSSIDGVVNYATVPDKGTTVPASKKQIRQEDVEQAAGLFGSQAPAIMSIGSKKSAATENGIWDVNRDAQTINDKLVDVQDILIPIEQQMGDGGNETLFTKGNKFEQIGAEFNDYPSIRIDEEGRSQPLEMIVSETGTFKNHDSVPHIEEIDNTSNFPCGNDDAVIGNRLSRLVGSGGIQFKTTGSTELGGSTFKVGFKRININASHGIQIASESFVELQSLKTITLRTNRQVYIESALGVKGNAIIGGGMSVEGELYCHHITAPLEVHQTQDTIVQGKFAVNEDRKLLIGEAQVGGEWYPVYAINRHDLIVNYPHSHHHNGIPMRLTKSNKDVRNFASIESINTHNNISQALPQNHERKIAQECLFDIIDNPVS